MRTRRDGNHVFYRAQNVHVRGLVEQALFHTSHVTGNLPDHDHDEPPGHSASADRRPDRRPD